jgi:hypothetical protein
MDSQALTIWNTCHPVGTSVMAKLPAGYNDGKPLATKTRSTAYMVDGRPWVMVSGISVPVALADISDIKEGPKFQLRLTTQLFDDAHLEAFKSAVATMIAEADDVHIEGIEPNGDSTWWVTISAKTAQRVFHLGARMGKWLAEEKGTVLS